MGDPLRVLTPSGVGRFSDYLAAIRAGSMEEAPAELLTSQEHSTAFADVVVERPAFASRFQFGSYLNNLLSPLDRRVISRHHGLWTWFALYYFDLLCPRPESGSRRVLADEAYVLPAKYDFRSYYRHLVRTPWLAVVDHGDNAKVLLIPAGQSGDAPLATHGEVMEQLASRQAVLGNTRVIQRCVQTVF